MNCRIKTHNNTVCSMFTNRDGTVDITIKGVTFKRLSDKEYFFFINNF